MDEGSHTQTAGRLPGKRGRRYLAAYTGISCLPGGQREDGCIPDRVNVAGQPVYSPGSPGKPMADHALDNTSFMAMMVCSNVDQCQDESLFRKLEPQLSQALDFVTVGK